jgi:uncharacterized membrane protein YjjB (DUF3815 family)
VFEVINHLWLMQVCFSGIAILGFSIRSNIYGWKLVFTSLGGALSWGLYLMFLAWSNSLLLSIFLSTALVCLYSELVAKAYHVPVAVFVICAIIPLVPGSGLYYSMTAYISGNINDAMRLMGNTLMIAGTISVAIALVSSLANIFKKVIQRF